MYELSQQIYDNTKKGPTWIVFTNPSSAMALFALEKGLIEGFGKDAKLTEEGIQVALAGCDMTREELLAWLAGEEDK